MLIVRLRDLALLVAVSVELLVSCEQPGPVPSPVAAPPVDPIVQAREAVKLAQHASAVTLLHQAIHARPDSLEAHYLLAVSQSYLDQADEAGREFEWVVGHAEPGSAEATIAREWLAARTATPMAVAGASDAAPADDPAAGNPELASLSGKAEDARGPKSRLLLFFKGAHGSAVGDEYRTLRTDSQGRFQFANVKPGDYVLTNAVAGPVTWRLRVSLARGERRSLDLSPSNDTSVRDDAPETR